MFKVIQENIFEVNKKYAEFWHQYTSFGGIILDVSKIDFLKTSKTN